MKIAASKYLLALSFTALTLFSQVPNALGQTQTPQNPNAESALSHANEQRARDIGHALRCVVCQNQSIEESDASLAEDMRRLVRARVEAGDSNEDVIAYMQNRYGDFVLLKPPVQANTYILWFLPFVTALVGLLWFRRQNRRVGGRGPAPLTQEEQEALKKLSETDKVS